ncbi:MAG: hypothetical protein LH631_11915, partial [Alkalinema sp. CAN_BIN05]|nr:hypothetical protein [Alkalinema sp. CAN_BIN05]
MTQQATLLLSTKDVIHIEGFQENASLFKNESTLRIQTILQQIQTACTESGMDLSEVNALMKQGIPCEILQPGATDWQVGRIRLSLEFQLNTALSVATPVEDSVALESSTVIETPIAEVITVPAIVSEVLEIPEVVDDLAAPVEDSVALESSPLTEIPIATVSTIPAIVPEVLEIPE